MVSFMHGRRSAAYNRHSGACTRLFAYFPCVQFCLAVEAQQAQHASVDAILSRAGDGGRRDCMLDFDKRVIRLARGSLRVTAGA